ncbi:hypothetical protein [Nocardia transvalensis]|uniref:hypothetical protein n=1 Tax=Nocardia transvalensis TaxID=37333 RepID=UPI001894E78D|nr:hypothetical protein [Nocardia transvalensis]MBF6333547.1 hypothetical protein [Nocardia transvalensis]
MKRPRFQTHADLDRQIPKWKRHNKPLELRAIGALVCSYADGDPEQARMLLDMLDLTPQLLGSTPSDCPHPRPESDADQMIQSPELSRAEGIQ